MLERRKLERFSLQTPAKLRVEREGSRSDVVSLVTRDISSSGVYITTGQPLPMGVRVKLELLISMDMIKRIIGEGGKARVKVDGQVVRADDRGMAIQFGSRFKIQPVGGPSFVWGILALIT
jgi:hypothetical protein